MSSPRDKYKALVEWCRMMGSFDYYIDNQCACAEFEDAPEDAIYKRSEDGVWRTVRDLAPDHEFRVRMERLGAQ